MQSLGIVIAISLLGYLSTSYVAGWILVLCINKN